MKRSGLSRVAALSCTLAAVVFAGCGGSGSPNPNIGLDPSNPGVVTNSLNSGNAQVFQPGGAAVVRGRIDVGTLNATAVGREASAVGVGVLVTASSISATGARTAVQSVRSVGDGVFTLTLNANVLYEISAALSIGGNQKVLRRLLLPGDSHNRTLVEDVAVDAQTTAHALYMDALVASGGLAYAALNGTVRAVIDQVEAAVAAAPTGSIQNAVTANLSSATALDVTALLAAYAPQVGAGLTTVATASAQSSQTILQRAQGLLAASFAAAAPTAAGFTADAITLTNYRGYGIAVRPDVTAYSAVAFGFDHSGTNFATYGTPGGKSLSYAPVRGFIITPEGIPPSGGWPVIIYQHGITRQAADAFLIAKDFTQRGYAVVAMDAVLHGRRQPGARSETGAFLTGGPVALDAGTLAAGGRCVLDQTTATAVPNGAAYLFNYFGCGSLAAVVPGEANAFPAPSLASVAAGNPTYDISMSWQTGIYVRDNQIQTVEDLRALIRYLGANANALDLNANKFYFTGMSLGVLNGSIAVALNQTRDVPAGLPGIKAAAFNVGGVSWGVVLSQTTDTSFGELAQNLFQQACPTATASYQACATALATSLNGLVDGLSHEAAALGTPGVVAGMDSGEPAHWVGSITSPVLIQTADNDAVFKPDSSNRLKALLDARTCAGCTTRQSIYSAAHGFFLDPSGQNAKDARLEIVQFFNAH